MRSIGVVDGREVLERPDCNEWFEGAGLTTVPLVTSDGWTPTWGAPPDTVEALVKKLEDAGLIVTMEVTDPSAAGDVGTVTDLPAGSYLGVSPELGSPIEVGGTVTITVMGRPDGQKR